MSEITAIAATETDASDGLTHLAYKGHVGGGSGDATMSVGDFVDMINPLQHIPVISAMYRDVSGDEISPMARIAGDTLYGAALGPASAGISAMLAIADEAFSANNDGNSISTTVVSGLFGSDEVATTKVAANDVAATTNTVVASADTAKAYKLVSTKSSAAKAHAAADAQQQNENTKLAALQTISNHGVLLDGQPLSNGAAQTSTTKITAMAEASKLGSDQTSVAAGMPLDRGKMPYGGAMDTQSMQSAMQNQSAALAMAGSQNKIKAEHALRNARLAQAAPVAMATTTAATATTDNAATTTAPIVQAKATEAGEIVAKPVASATAPASTAATSSTSDPIPASLINDLIAARGLNQYRNTAQSFPAVSPGSDTLN